MRLIATLGLSLALLTSGCGHASSTATCIDGAICAGWAPFAVEELVHTPEVCRSELVTMLRQTGVLDGSAVAIEVQPWSAEPARRRVTATAIARALTGFVHQLGTSTRVISVVDATDAPQGCASEDIHDLAVALARAGADGPGTTARDGRLGEGTVELFCRSPRAAGSRDRRGALLWRIPTPGVAGAHCRATRGDQTCADGALVDLAISGTAAGRKAARREGGDLSGFVWSAAHDTRALRNERFAFGFASWETSGGVALRLRGDSHPDRCAPMLANLSPGAALRQSPRRPPGAPVRPQSRNLMLAIDVEPAATERRLLVGSGAATTELPIAPGTSECSATLPGSRGTEAVTVTVPTDAHHEVALRSVRIAEDIDDRRSVRSGRHERALRWLTTRTLPNEDMPAPRDQPVRLETILDDARVLFSDEDFVRVERFGSEDPSLRSGILAHPGTNEPTRLEFDLPETRCPRRFSARVTIAPDCRATSDGVLFRAHSDSATISASVGGPGHPTDAPLELIIDEPNDASAPRSARTLVLETESGPAHDTRCDWAVWAEPTVSCGGASNAASGVAPAVPTGRILEIPAGSGSVITTAWDEINVWKLYAFFGPMGAKARHAAQEPDWLIRRLPWLTHVRVLAALGGNTCRHIRSSCEHSERTVDHPFDPPCWEGRDGRAAAYELLQDENPPRVDAAVWGAALDDLLRSGVKPHLNLSAAPCLLTGGEHHYRDYHWNQVPVADHDGYEALLRVFAEQVRHRGAGPEWRLSIVNEPNCLWIARPPGSSRFASPEVAHIGFLGDATNYAAQFASTARLLRELLPGIRLHIGNFTIGGKYPLEDNLAEYLGALAPALDHAGVPVSDLSAISFSIYESPQHGLDDLPAYKFGIVDRARGPASAFRDLPIKLDEVEIHPLVAQQFQSNTGEDIDATRWAAMWHADMAAMAIDTGVRSLAPWLGRLIPDDELEQPLPKYWSYALLSLVTGQAIAPDGPLAKVAALHPPTERNGAAPRLLALHRAAEDRDGLGWLVTREPESGVVWVALWRHAQTPVADATADTQPSLDVLITAPGSAPSEGSGVVQALSMGPATSAGDPHDGPPADAQPWAPGPFRTTAVRSWQASLGKSGVRLALGQESLVVLRFPPDRAPEDKETVRPSTQPLPSDAT